MKKNKISKNWINKQRRDIYVRQSKVEGYRSRAVYKLQEIDEKFKIFKNGISLIDLGAAPGSWSQYAAKKIKNSKILSIDLNEIKKIGNTFQLKGDFTDSKYKSKIKEYFGGKIDVVLSDMAVNTTGNKNLDSIYTGELCIDAINFSKEIENLYLELKETNIKIWQIEKSGCSSTQEEVDKTTKSDIFKIVVPGEAYVCAYPGTEEDDQSVSAMKQKLRDMKKKKD